VSGVISTSAADGSRSDAGEARPARGTGWITPVNVVIVVATLVALGLRLYYQSVDPGFLLGVTEYDDGPYFGSAVRLVYGVLPYRDFILVQPPGITLLMTPVALLARVTGTAWGLAIGRILTVLASTAGVALAGVLVRHRGLLTVLITCGIMAIYPDGVAAAHTVLVEPWLVLFCLLGALSVFEGEHLAGVRRLAWGGVAFGFAGAIEPWAIVPVVVLLGFCLSLPELKRLGAFAGGVAAGFLVPVLPFAIIGPRQFYESLITAQVGPRHGTPRVGVATRLDNMLGLTNPHGHGSAITLVHTPILAVLAALVVLAFLVAGFAAAWLTARRAPSMLHQFVLLTTLLIVVMFMWPKQFHYHFAAFLAPFLALAIGLAASSLVTAARPLADSVGAGRWLGRASVGVAAAVLVAATIGQVGLESTVPRVIGPVPAAIDRIIPPGSCVLTDEVSLTLLANRFVSDVPGCSQMVDGLGTDLGLSGGRTPGDGAGLVPAVAAVWTSAFEHAQYVWLSWGEVRRVAWTPALMAYFHAHFVEVYSTGRRETLYARKGLRAR
jgi:alpha-1,2-mannosyltransferase